MPTPLSQPPGLFSPLYHSDVMALPLSYIILFVSLFNVFLPLRMQASHWQGTNVFITAVWLQD